ncbi:MAG: divergent polysaccharide deacetylase family protein [Alphaproteobacteria bacterium]|nr:divergent polysaccharide deacetylase family protein [Alphaproteobacteria bacterium]
MRPGKLKGGKGSDAPPSSEPDDDDIPEHLRPTFFQRKAHILPVAGAYGVFLLVGVGIATYLLIKGPAIEAEMEASIPRAEISNFQFVNEQPETDHSDTVAEAPTGAVDAPGEDTAHNAPSTGEPGTPPSDTAVAPALTDDAAEPPLASDGPDPYAGNLAAYPDPGLIEDIESVGTVPKAGQDGRVPWKVYARPSSSLETRPRIAVVVVNLGLSVESTEAAIALPGAVTLSFSPYAPNLKDWIAQARTAGHEVMVGLPMEPRDFPRSDAGLLSLMTSVDAEQNILNLQRVMSEGSGYIGLVNYQGSGFTSSRAALQPVMEDLSKRGLIYFDTLDNATSVAPEVAKAVGMPHATGDMMIDASESRGTVLERLTQLELLAKTQNTAVVSVKPFPMLLQRVKRWSRELSGKGMVLTPLSGIITARIRES